MRRSAGRDHDGASKTILLGERRHDDDNYESFAAQGWTQSLKTWGWWGTVGRPQSHRAHHDGLATARSTITLPFSFGNGASASPPATDGVSFGYYVDLRTCALGNNDAGWGELCHGGWFVRLMTNDTPLPLLQGLSTRAGGETVVVP